MDNDTWNCSNTFAKGISFIFRYNINLFKFCVANLEVDLSYLDVFRFQIIPRIMPSIVGEDKIKERFDNGGGEMEHIFREKFLQNLNVSFFIDISEMNIILFC